jgi:Bacterial mobilisation protein (MobC)
MPRPVKDDPRVKFKTFRFTEAEVTRLQARAKGSGQTLSSYVRARLLEGSTREEAPPQDALSEPPRTLRGKYDAYWRMRQTGIEGSGSPADTAPRTSVPKSRILAEQLRRVGVNLNQIAHRMNELRIPPPRELTMVLDEIRTYVRQVREP